MGATEEIIKMAKENNGTFTTAMSIVPLEFNGQDTEQVSHEISCEL